MIDEKVLVRVLRSEKRQAKKCQRGLGRDAKVFYEGWEKCCAFLLMQVRDGFRGYVADLDKAKEMRRMMRR